MKRILNYVIVPFWSQHFSTLRTDENVNHGYFRIGQLMLTTKINNCCVILAEVNAEPKNEIQSVATDMAGIIESRIDQYNQGLICAGEFIDSVYTALGNATTDANHSTCNMRLPSCGKCPAEKVKGDEAHEAREQSHYEWLNAHRNLR